jgi:hypothetical protein
MALIEGLAELPEFSEVGRAPFSLFTRLLERLARR